MAMSIFAGLFGGRRSSGGTGDPFSPGAVFAFRTSPGNEFAEPETGRWAAIKIIGADAAGMIVAVLEGVWESPPSLGEVRGAGVLRESRFEMAGRPPSASAATCGAPTI